MPVNPPCSNNTSISSPIKLSHDGRGVAYINGKITFLQGGLPGEIVKFKYIRKHASFDEGQVIEILKPAAERVSPACEYFNICGGCQLQYLDSEAQIQHKQNVLLEILQNQANIIPTEILSPLKSNPWGYRRKARLSVKYVAKKNKVLVGFREKNSHLVANIERCPILPLAISALLPKFSELFYSLSIREQIPQMEIAITKKENAIIIRHLAAFNPEDLEKIKSFVITHHLKCYLQPSGMDSIHLFWPIDADPLLSYRIDQYGLTLYFSPQQFIQINDSINQHMVNQALNLLDLKSTDRVLDLFCGIGNFSLPLAQYCERVIGIEGDRSAVETAKINAVKNNIDNAEFFCEDLNKISYGHWSMTNFNKILLDPPRSGAKVLMPWIVSHHPSHIVYISCNPITLARDAVYLVQQGYRLTKTGVMDMFPHTQHIEAIALFIKDSSSKT